MGIQPIDLQTLYTQLDKIGKTQVQQQLAAQTVRDAQIQTNKLKSEQKLKTVQETDAGNEQTGIVHEWKGSDGQNAADTADQEKGESKPDSAIPAETKKEVIRDPDLGTHIDISG